MSKVLWFTGLSGAGKTTIANMLLESMQQCRSNIEMLDGNKVRDFFDNDLGFSPEDRQSATKRIVFTSYMLAKNGVNVLVTNIAPSYDIRDFVREKLAQYYLQIYCKASIDVVRKRDVWGHYAMQEQGKDEELVGIDYPYQEPRKPDLVLHTDTETEQESFEKLKIFLKNFEEFRNI